MRAGPWAQPRASVLEILLWLSFRGWASLSAAVCCSVSPQHMWMDGCPAEWHNFKWAHGTTTTFSFLLHKALPQNSTHPSAVFSSAVMPFIFKTNSKWMTCKSIYTCFTHIFFLVAKIKVSKFINMFYIFYKNTSLMYYQIYSAYMIILGCNKKCYI